MPTDCITYQNSAYFSKLIVDYLDKNLAINGFYNRYPNIENFKAQLKEKESNFNNENRQVLVSELEKQYLKFNISETTINNIKLLNNSKTFTITTGHQLNLFTGPLYFIYKIVSTINLCKELKLAYPEYNFVPIYWMATEDHDFEEINYFNFKNKKFQWKKESVGPVGRLSTDSLKELFNSIETEFRTSQNAQTLIQLFKNSYLKHTNLADATRFLANELFKSQGLVILDGDAFQLKKLFIPFIKEELLHQTSFKKVNQTITLLKEYTIQVNPREINLFYIEDNLRERIIFENNSFKVNNTTISFSEKEICELAEKNPEKFSPNVIVRPLYQEVILPNLCYIGGGGEIAYWLELKSNFEANNITFPMLLLRNSALLVSQKQIEKANKLELTWANLFLKQQNLLDIKTKEYSSFKIDFSEQKEHLKKQFENLHSIAFKTDRSFNGAVKAQEIKQIKGLENLEKRLLKAEKRVHSDKLQRISSLQNELFPNQSLQERNINFSEFYLEYGNSFIEKIINELRPLEQEFKVIIL